MDLLHENGLIFGNSVCYTSKNMDAVTSDEFFDLLIEHGSCFGMVLPSDAGRYEGSTELMPTREQREYIYHRIREVRGFTGGKEIFVMDFQNDGEYVGGCIAEEETTATSTRRVMLSRVYLFTIQEQISVRSLC